MIKKLKDVLYILRYGKNNKVYVTLLLVVFLSILYILESSNAYASQVMLTYQDCQDINNKYNTGQLTRMWNAVQNYQNTYNCVTITIYGRNEPYSCYVTGFNVNQIQSVSNLNNKFYMQINLNNAVGKRMLMSSGTQEWTNRGLITSRCTTRPKILHIYK